MTPTPPPDATPSQRGLMSAAAATKLAAYPDDPSSLGGGVDTLASVGSAPNANGGTIDGDTLTLQPADETHPGLLTAAAQTIGGAKTFAALLTAALGVVTNLVRAVGATLVLRSSLGAGSTDVAVRLGTEVSDGSTHESAKILSLCTGIGSTEVLKLYATKTQLNGYGLNLQPQQGWWTGHFTFTGGIGYIVTVGGALVVGNTAAITGRLSVTGRIDQSGTIAGSAGNVTINKPTGIASVASGATSVVVTNSLVTATTRPMATPLANPGSHWWVTRTAGSFTIHLSSAAPTDVAFAWQVSEIL